MPNRPPSTLVPSIRVSWLTGVILTGEPMTQDRQPAPPEAFLRAPGCSNSLTLIAPGNAGGASLLGQLSALVGLLRVLPCLGGGVQGGSDSQASPVTQRQQRCSESVAATPSRTVWLNPC